MSDLISRKYVVKELLKERERYPAMVAERYSFGVKTPHRFNQAMRGGIRKALRIAETAPAVDAVNVVRCRDCKHNEQITAPRGYIYCSRWDICTVDYGFCHMGAKIRGDNDAAD